VSQHPGFASDWGQAFQFRTSADAARRQTRGFSRTPRRSLLRMLALRNMAPDTLLIVLYVALSRAFIGDEATLGIKVGPLPVFVTDALLAIVITISFHRRGGHLLNWLFTGTGAGQSGRAVWLLFLLALMYGVAAFPRYQIMALHDLAIFAYCIFFPVTYFALTQPEEAAKLVRYSVYATCIGAILFNFQVCSGIQLFALGQNLKGLPGHVAVAHLNANNLGADLGPALAALFAYFSVEKNHRTLHAGAILLCFATLAQLMDRSAFLGFSMAAGVMFLLGVGQSRLYLTALAGCFLFLLLLAGQAELPIPGGARLHSFWLTVSSGANVENDPDGQFRLQRWRKTVQTWLNSPVFGVGFGAPIIVDAEGENLRGEKKGAAERGALGAFNVGMPHNSFLMALARTGLIGLTLICFAWLAGIFRVVKQAVHGIINADQVASVGILIAMIATAALNLFFERPMLCAPFWILLAASYRLSEGPRRRHPTRFWRVTPPINAGSVSTPKYLPPIVTRSFEPGGWQARWK
jgi:O-antigen ligase